MKKAPTTLRDVAKKAGVHFSTVSRALNPETRQLVASPVAEKILRIADQLEYRANESAVSLKTKRSFLIGVFLPDITDPFYPPIVVGVRKRLMKSPYVAIVGDAERPVGQERHSLRAMKMRPMGGLVLATAKLKDIFVEEAIAERVPHVQVLQVTAKPASSTVVVDQTRGMSLLVQHLWSLGHRRIAHVIGPQDVSTGVGNLAGFRAAMQAAGAAADDGLIQVAGGDSIEAGRMALEGLLGRRKRFTAVVAGSATLALGCLDAIKANGLACPQDISVCGYNDVPLLDRISPALTTISADTIQVGWFAADLLVRAIEHPSAPPMHIVVQPTLVVRESTVPAR